MNLHPGPQGLHIDRLPYVVHGSEVQPANFLVKFIVIRQDNDRDVVREFTALQFSKYLKAVHNRHIEVENNEIKVRIFFYLPESLDTIAGGYEFTISQHTPDGQPFLG